ncbi:MAG: hypothetical protein NTV22_18650 [bacterium]|nr:hypothetical protein [bacterium]
MIVPMKKVTVVCLAHAQEATLLQLRALGVLHVQATEKPQHATAADVTAAMRDTDTVIELLQLHAPKTPVPRGAVKKAAVLVREMLAVRERMTQRNEDIARQRAELDRLAVWGEFEPQQLQALRARGVQVALYHCTIGEVPRIPAGCVLHEVRRTKDTLAFVLVSDAPFEVPLAAVALPEKAPAALRAALAAREQQQAEDRALLAQHAGAVPALQHARRALNDELQLAQARDATGRVETLVYLCGFVPHTAVAPIEAAAHAHGWGLLIEEPGPDDNAPTLIRNPRWLQPVETVFSFIDTFPGYHERDISVVFYLFFSLFYAMLIGDAGYGLVFLAITALIQWRKGNVIPKQPLYLMYVLNIATVVWGVLTGSYFSIPLPHHALLKKFVVLDTSNFEATVYVCFIIALVHLALAHLWNAYRIINSWRALEQVSWACIVVTMYFAANTLLLNRPFPSWVGYFGAVAILTAVIFAVWGKVGEELVAAMIQFPFGVINCFGDIASYIRLFAVGFAGAATAQAFNAIAQQIGMNTIATGFVVALILVAGHALNMILGLLAVIVHGLRLNTLEFSGHLGLEWSGHRYRPLAQQEPAGKEASA